MLININTIIVDSSVWIDYFNGKITPHTNMLENFLTTSKPIAITDVIMMEVLQGFRSDKDFNNAQKMLDIIRCYDILGKNNAIKYAKYYRQLRQKGITIRKSNDVMIAGFCLENGCSLLFNDKDFIPFVEHLGLSQINVLQ